MFPRRKACIARSETGRPCRAAPLRDRDFCIMHDPDQAEAMREARRLGGLRRKREATVSGAYGIERFDTIDAARRLVEVATLDVLGLENSIPRARLLLQAAQTIQKLMEAGEMEERLQALEAFTHRQRSA